MYVYRVIHEYNEPNEICDAANITFEPILWI
jgi:hypothetical protein